MSLIDRYVADLFNYAAYGSNEERQEQLDIDKNRLQSFYNYAVIWMRGSGDAAMPDELVSFLELLSPEDAEAVLLKFIGEARDALGWLDVRIFSAMPLNVEQRRKIEEKLVDIFGREVSMIFRVDPSLIGGLRVVAGDAVLDNTIKTGLTEMKKNVYKEVYSKR